VAWKHLITDVRVAGSFFRWTAKVAREPGAAGLTFFRSAGRVPSGASGTDT